VHDFFHPERIVVGADRPEDAQRVSSLYDGVEAPRVLTDIRTAEMIKYVSNAFLATKVSFINEIARLCERLGVDVDVVAHAAALDTRIGGQYFSPGVGYGGSCLPKDVAALYHTGESVGLTMRLLSSVQDVNISQRKHVVNSIRAIAGPLEGLTIAAWGVTFKSGSEDLRESPAVDIIGLLRNEGAHVRVYDPSLREDRGFPIADEVCKSALDAARDADCVAILTDWPELARVDLAELRSVMKGNLLYDGRDMLDRAAVEGAGLVYCGIGRPVTGSRPANGRNGSRGAQAAK
jgi:UDPglucose 6-dehydrogenase